jgi:hypothetical protein
MGSIIQIYRKRLSFIFRYLMEKYANRWRTRMEKQEEPALPSETTDEDWLRQVLFTPSSRSARQIACTIVESLCQVRLNFYIVYLYR